MHLVLLVEASFFIGANGARVDRIGIGDYSRRAGCEQMVGESANEGGAVAAADHVGFADELIDAARSSRMQPQPVLGPSGLRIALQIREGAVVLHDNELV